MFHLELVSQRNVDRELREMLRSAKLGDQAC